MALNKSDPIALQKLRDKVKNKQTTKTTIQNTPTDERVMSRTTTSSALRSKSDPEALQRLRERVAQEKKDKGVVTPIDFNSQTRNAFTSVPFKSKIETKSTGEKILDSTGYIGEKLGRGIVDGLEGITDFAYSVPLSLGWLITGGGGLWENPVSDKFESWYNYFNQDDITDYWGDAEKRYDAAPQGVKDWGWLPEGVGQMAPFIVETIATQGSTLADDFAVAGKSIWDTGRKLLTNPELHFGMSAAGGATEEAIQKGANPLTATTYGAASGAVEVATEKLFGGLAGTGVGKPFVKISSKSPFISKTLDILGEGVEEQISTGIDPLLQRATGVDTNAEWASWSDYVESGTHGIILSVAMNSATMPIQKYGKNKVIKELNKSSQALNEITNDDAPKMQPLATNATEEDIKKRQAEIRAVAIAYNNFVKQNVENEQQTTIEQPATQTSKEAVETRKQKATPLVERLEALSQNNEQITVEDVKKATGFGEEGSRLVTELANNDGITFSQAERTVKNAYMAGFADVDSAKVNFETDAQINAFTAGKKDRVMQNTSRKEDAKNATVYDSGVVNNENFQKLSKPSQELLSTLAKDHLMSVEVKDSVLAAVVNGKRYEANASHNDGVMVGSMSAEKPLIMWAIHEDGHRMEQMATDEWNVLANALFERAERLGRRAKLGVSQGMSFDAIKSQYNQAGLDMDTSGYMGEVVMRELETIFASPEEFNAWRVEIDNNAQVKTAWQKFMDFLVELIEDIKNLIKGDRISREAKAEAKKDLAELEHIKKLYAEAYKATKDAVAERAKNTDANSAKNLEIKINKDYNGNTSHSLKDEDLRTQIKYSPKGIKLPQNEFAKFYRSTSTDYHKSYKTHEGLQYQSCVTDDTHILYIYEDGGFGKYNVVAKIDYAQEDVVDLVVKEIRNGETYRITNLVNRIVKIIENRRGSYTLYNSYTKERRRSGGYGVISKGQSKSDTRGTDASSGRLAGAERENGNSLNNKKSSSLKGGIDVSSKKTTAFLNAVEDVQKGQKGASERLSKYVEDGMIRTEEYEELIQQYGAIPNGENPYREIQVPQKTEKKKKVSRTVRTILEAKATPNEAVPTIEKMIEDGVFSYDAYTDKQAINDAESHIKEYGWDESLDDWFDDMEKGVVSKQHTAMGWALYNNAANIAATTTSETERTTAIKTSLKLLDAMVRHQRSAAQALQATRILKKLSPETQLYGVQKSVHALQNELIDKYGDKAPDLKIDEELAEQFINAKTQEEREVIEKEIYKDIGRQMPSRFIDKWNAWRYLAMLGNLRTHVRNVVGNAGFAPIVVTKDLTASAIESVVNRISGKKTVRGKAIITGNKTDRALLKAAWGDYGSVADMISNGGKYNDSAIANQQIEEGRQIFKTKPLEWARKKNSALLEVEDMWFAQPHYAYALAQYCKANNITAEQIQKGKAIAPARAYAIKEAQKATYRDANAFSQMVSEWGRNRSDSKHPVKKVFSTVIEGILPFRKTPANILVRGVEYSPLGLLKGLSYDLYRVREGKMSATEAIDNISAGLTGTGLLTLGVLLAAQGLVRGHGEGDKDEKEFKELMGHQAYALELPNGQSITLDWLAPEALPFFVGVNVWEATKGSGEEANFSTILNAVSNISEPMLEMSCLQSLNDLFEGIGYASSNDTSGLVSILSSATTSYLTQGMPTLLGQAERTGEENRMTTYTEKDNFFTSDIQYTFGRASAKIPLWDYNQIPYIDAWGRKEASGTALKRGLNNFLNPSYTSTIDTSKMEKELLRLYEKTGESSVFPSRASKYFTVDGKRKDLTAEQYVRYATLKGQKSYKLISDLVKSKAYKTLDDEGKIRAIDDAYTYADQKAKQAISNYKPDSWINKADEFGSNVGNYLSFRANVNSTKDDNGGNVSKQDVVDIILDMAQNDAETWKMYLSMYDSEKDMYAYNKGVSGGIYMNFLDSLSYVDQPTKSGKYGTYTQEEAYRAVKRLNGLSQQEKAVLWQSVNTSWKASNNPFR